MAKAERFVQIKVTLNDIRPPIWRRLVLPSATTLEDLHFIILAAMNGLDALRCRGVKSDPKFGNEEPLMTLKPLKLLDLHPLRHSPDG